MDRGLFTMGAYVDADGKEGKGKKGRRGNCQGWRERGNWRQQRLGIDRGTGSSSQVKSVLSEEHEEPSFPRAQRVLPSCKAMFHSVPSSEPGDGVRTWNVLS